MRLTSGVRVVVNVTSDKCYENREWVWGYRENDPLGGHDPYSASKGCAKLIFSAYLRSFFNRQACGDRRIGAGDWQDLSEPGVVHEAATLRLYSDKAVKYLGWRNFLSMEQAIDLTKEVKQ